MIQTNPDTHENQRGSRATSLLLSDPIFFIVQRARLSAINTAFFVLALGVFALLGWWDSMYFLVAGIFLGFVLQVGAPLQIVWRGPKAREMREHLEAFLELARYRKQGTTGNWDIWVKPRAGWKGWLPKMAVYIQAGGDSVTVRGPSDYLSLLRMKFC